MGDASGNFEVEGEFEVMIIKGMKNIFIFCKSNKFLSVISALAIISILFYGSTYNINEQWYNTHAGIEILFQLSLALTANLIFYIFQIYIPSQIAKQKMRPIIKRKEKYISLFIGIPFSNIAEKYLECNKALDELTPDDMQIILENYKFDDSIFKVGKYLQKFGDLFRETSQEVKQVIDELLSVYRMYMTDEEEEILIELRSDSFCSLLSSPLLKESKVVGIKDNNALEDFIGFQKIYKKLQGILKN